MTKLKDTLKTSNENPAVHYYSEGIIGKPIKFIGNEYIKETFEDGCIQQAINTRNAPGVEEVVINPDAHIGYGTPIGTVVKTSDVIFPGPVGVDIKCSMSHLQLDLPEEEIADKRVRRAVINAIEERMPTGAGKGQRSVPKSRKVDTELGLEVATSGASKRVCNALNIPEQWINKCEDSHHGESGEILDYLGVLECEENNFYKKLLTKFEQLGSYGGGNHFLSGDVTRVLSGQEKLAEDLGLLNGHVSTLSHCGSRGFGHLLATHQFAALEKFFDKWRMKYPADDKHLVYAPVDSVQGWTYLQSMYMGANFATVNHLLLNAFILEAFQEIFPGVKGDLVYFISHNIAREEVINNKKSWIHRKGATRAYPAGHFSLKETPFYDTGHPILLPGNVIDGSYIMVASEGAESNCFSVNHGAGRRMGRRQAFRELDQSIIDKQMHESGILTNLRKYPADESAAVYKDFEQVIDSVEQANLAFKVAKLEPKFVIKDGDKSLKGAA